MKVSVQFFSHLKDIVGAGHRELDLPEGTKTGDLLVQLYEQHPALRAWDNSILLGAGVEFVGRNYVIQAGDDISVMPPVQGG